MNKVSNSNPFKLLMIEDSEDDINLVKRAFNEIESPVEISVIHHSDEVFDLLKKWDEEKDQELPDMIILDLIFKNQVSGKLLLKEIKSHENIKKIPVIVFSISDSPTDVDESYKLNANCYITKPLEYERLVNIIKVIEKFWFGLVKFPTRIY